MSNKLDHERINKQKLVERRGATPVKDDIAPTGTRADRQRFAISKQERKERIESYKKSIQNQLHKLNSTDKTKKQVLTTIFNALSGWIELDADALADPVAKIAANKISSLGPTLGIKSLVQFTKDSNTKRHKK
jgi:hypothetical protein